MIAGIVLGIVAGLLANELCEFSPWCARKLVRWSAFRRYTDPSRAEMRAEELTAVINDRPGNLFNLITAVSFAANAVIVSGRHAVAPRQPDAGSSFSPALSGLSHIETLGPPAIRTIDSLLDASDREKLEDAVLTELINGPNASRECTFASDGRPCSDRPANSGEVVYTATPLSFAGYTAIHRRMTDEELKRLEREQGGPAAAQGIYVIDILPTESAFTRSVPRSPH